MHVRRRRLSNFEALSAALFAALAATAAQPVRAQPAQAPTTSSSPSSTTSTTSTRGGGTVTSQLGPAPSGAIAPNRWTAGQIAEAFKRTDSNGDGTISQQEAQAWAGLARRFDQVDTNKDGLLSRAEFEDALK